ncbi:MAG: hypothetical protein AAF683_11495 [Pseudomonadota bacterium]
MEKPSLADDIAFARAMAEEGATAPTLSGRFAIMWSAITIVGFLTHWAIADNVIPVDISLVGFVWLAVGIIGGIGTAILCYSLREKPGQFTAGNKAEAAGWPVIGVIVFGMAFAIGIGVAFRDQPPVLFDMIIPMAFGFYAVMTALSVKLFGTRSGRWRVALAAIIAIMSSALVGLPELYLIAAAGIVFTQLIPGFSALRAEPKAVV